MKILPVFHSFSNINAKPFRETSKGILGSVYTKMSEIDKLQYTKIRLQLTNWHKEHSNLRFMVFGDLHANKHYLNKDRLNLIVESINKKRPDFVFMLGDFLYGKSKNFKNSLSPEDISASLERIKAPKYAVLGNHDCIIAPDRMRDALKGTGVNILNNESVPITINGKKFFISGIDDILEGKPDLQKTLAQTDGRNPIILLSHNPNIFDKVPECVSLVLAGHTHNMQVKIPGIRDLITLFSECPTEYLNGKYTFKGKTMLVTQGIGVSGVPLRYNVNPEILDLNIRRK